MLNREFRLALCVFVDEWNLASSEFPGDKRGQQCLWALSVFLWVSHCAMLETGRLLNTSHFWVSETLWETALVWEKTPSRVLQSTVQERHKTLQRHLSRWTHTWCHCRWGACSEDRHTPSNYSVGSEYVLGTYNKYETQRCLPEWLNFI